VFEATEPRERRCGQCRLPGYTRNSLRCMHNIRLLNQEFETDRVAQSSTIATALDISDSEDSHTNSQLQPRVARLRKPMVWLSIQYIKEQLIGPCRENL
jgi:hypothetical protein